jgi:uncharacterized glyoxalase superfamily protein PhnB
MAPNIFPAIRFHDAHAGIEFLTTALGFEADSVHEDDGAVVHAELGLGEGIVMVGTVGRGDTRLDRTAGNQSVYVAIEDVDAHYQRATQAGAEIERELEDTPYGSREYSARDPEGNRWSFGTYWPTR